MIDVAEFLAQYEATLPDLVSLTEDDDLRAEYGLVRGSTGRIREVIFKSLVSVEIAGYGLADIKTDILEELTL